MFVRAPRVAGDCGLPKTSVPPRLLFTPVGTPFWEVAKGRAFITKTSPRLFVMGTAGNPSRGSNLKRRVTDDVDAVASISRDGRSKHVDRAIQMHDNAQSEIVLNRAVVDLQEAAGDVRALSISLRGQSVRQNKSVLPDEDPRAIVVVLEHIPMEGGARPTEDVYPVNTALHRVPTEGAFRDSAIDRLGLGVRAVAIDGESLHGHARGIIDGNDGCCIARSIRDGSPILGYEL